MRARTFSSLFARAFFIAGPVIAVACASGGSTSNDETPAEGAGGSAAGSDAGGSSDTGGTGGTSAGPIGGGGAGHGGAGGKGGSGGGGAGGVAGGGGAGHGGTTAGGSGGQAGGAGGSNGGEGGQGGEGGEGGEGGSSGSGGSSVGGGGGSAGSAGHAGNAGSGGKAGGGGASGAGGKGGSGGSAGSAGSAGHAGAAGSSGGAGGSAGKGGSGGSGGNNCPGTPCTITGQLGQCAVGVICSGTSVCVPKFGKTDEVCDGKDNNCNGVPDDGPPWADDTGSMCSTGLQGVCAVGVKTCAGGQQKCTEMVQPGPQQCNGMDNNCDGKIDTADPKVGMPCPVPGQKAGTPCATGQYACMNNTLNCVQTVHPSAELCDGMDNDCSGTPDDGDPTAECAASFPTAMGVSAWTCSGAKCAIVSCASGHIDLDGQAPDGCECAATTASTNCAAPTPHDVPANTDNSFVGILPAGVSEGFVSVSFDGYPGASASSQAHFSISLVANPDYAIDVKTSCGASATCNDGGNGDGVATWDFIIKHDGVCQACSDTSAIPTPVIVHIRRVGGTPSCNGYTLNFGNHPT